MIDTNNPPEFPNDTPESRISLRETIRKSGKPFDAERLDKADIRDRAEIAEREAAKAGSKPARPRKHTAADPHAALARARAQRRKAERQIRQAEKALQEFNRHVMAEIGQAVLLTAALPAGPPAQRQQLEFINDLLAGRGPVRIDDRKTLEGGKVLLAEFLADTRDNAG